MEQQPAKKSEVSGQVVDDDREALVDGGVREERQCCDHARVLDRVCRRGGRKLVIVDRHGDCDVAVIRRRVGERE